MTGSRIALAVLLVGACNHTLGSPSGGGGPGGSVGPGTGMGDPRGGGPDGLPGIGADPPCLDAPDSCVSTCSMTIATWDKGY